MKVGLGFAITCILIGLSACQKNIFESNSQNVSSLREIPALRLNFRFEADVPPPPAKDQNAQTEEKNAVVQTDFDQNRPQETLEKTIPSPDKKRILADFVCQKLQE